MCRLAQFFRDLLKGSPMYPVKDSTGTDTGSVVTPSPNLPPGTYTFEVPPEGNGGGGSGPRQNQ